MRRIFWKPLAGIVAALSVSALNVSAAQANPSLQVKNSGTIGIRILEINRDGQYWLELSGSDLAPGETLTQEWLNDSETKCTAQVHAFYEDRTTSEPVTVNVCEDDHIEFAR